MNKDDMKLLLISGLPHYINGLGEVEQIRLKKIIQYGYSKYHYFLNVLFLDPTVMAQSLEERELLKDLRPIDLAFVNKQFAEEFVKAVLFFLQREEGSIDYKNKVIKIDDLILDQENFKEFQDFIGYYCKVNDIDEKDDDEEVDEKTAEIRRKMKERQRRLGGNEPPLEMYDIISALTVKSNSLNKLNIYDLTIYQLHEEFERQEHVENYKTGLQSLMNGAKKEEVDLKHWSSKIEKTS